MNPNHTTIYFTLPENIAGSRLHASIMMVNKIRYNPDVGERSIMTRNVFEHNKYANVIAIAYFDTQGELLFKYTHIKITKYDANGENPTVVNVGQYVGSKDDYRCGDIGEFNSAITSAEATEEYYKHCHLI